MVRGDVVVVWSVKRRVGVHGAGGLLRDVLAVLSESCGGLVEVCCGDRREASWWKGVLEIVEWFGEGGASPHTSISSPIIISLPSPHSHLHPILPLPTNHHTNIQHSLLRFFNSPPITTQTSTSRVSAPPTWWLRRVSTLPWFPQPWKLAPPKLNSPRDWLCLDQSKKSGWGFFLLDALIGWLVLKLFFLWGFRFFCSIFLHFFYNHYYYYFSYYYYYYYYYYYFYFYFYCS